MDTRHRAGFGGTLVAGDLSDSESLGTRGGWAVGDGKGSGETRRPIRGVGLPTGDEVEQGNLLGLGTRRVVPSNGGGRRPTLGTFFIVLGCAVASAVDSSKQSEPNTELLSVL